MTRGPHLPARQTLAVTHDPRPTPACPPVQVYRDRVKQLHTYNVVNHVPDDLANSMMVGQGGEGGVQAQSRIVGQGGEGAGRASTTHYMGVGQAEAWHEGSQWKVG